MIETRLFFFGIFVVILFLTGILYTVKEFRELDQEEQKAWREEKKNIRIDEDFET